MPELAYATRALGARTEEALRTLGRPASVRMTEHPLDTALWLQFRLDDPAPVAALAATSGIALERGDRAVRHAGTTALCLGPGNWLLEPSVGGAAATDALKATLERAFAGMAHAVTDVSDLWFRVRVQGRYTHDVLAKSCALDLHPASFPAGATAVAQFARIRALVHHLDPSSGVDVCVERSYARYLWTWLADAMAEFIATPGEDE